MVGIRKTEKGIDIDFSTTLFMHEMFLLKSSDERKELQKLVLEKDNINLFRFLIDKLGSSIFYEIPEIN